MDNQVRQSVGGVVLGALLALLWLALRGASEELGAVLGFFALAVTGISLAALAYELLRPKSD